MYLSRKNSNTTWSTKLFVKPKEECTPMLFIPYSTLFAFQQMCPVCPKFSLKKIFVRERFVYKQFNGQLFFSSRFDQVNANKIHLSALVFRRNQ